MNETLKRAISGTVYVAIMWFGSSFSDLSRLILFSIITLISSYEMWKLQRKIHIISFYLCLDVNVIDISKIRNITFYLYSNLDF